MASQWQPYVDTAPILAQADDTEEEEKEGLRACDKGEEEVQALTGIPSKHAGLIVGVLFLINLLNYMDRFTVAGVLPDIEDFFGIDDSKSGLLQTVFISSYMVLAPIFGYLGDRYNRKYLMCVGIFFWSIVTLASSFIPKEWFSLLLLTRGLVGVGEASYSTIAPTIIADLFLGQRRSRMLSIFYFAIPVGSGLGYIVGSQVKNLAGDWHWALRVTPVLGAFVLLLLITVVRDPPRGAMETCSDAPLQNTSWAADLRALSRNRSFVLSSLGFTAVAFITGCLALWAPVFLYRSRQANGQPGPSGKVYRDDRDSLIFGIITCVTGVLGITTGVEISRRWQRTNPRADPLVCAFGLLFSAPFLYMALVCAQKSIVATYVFIFIGETLLSLNWAIIADILLYVVIPTRRSTAEAFQILLSHLLGDAGSPYLIGLISDAIQGDRSSSLLLRFQSLEYALMICAFVGVIGGGFFLATACFIQADRKRTELYAQGQLVESSEGEDRIVVPQHGRSTKVPVSSVLI